MLDTRWRKTWRDAWRHRARTLLVVLAVALGLIGGGAVLNAWALVRTTTQASYAASHPVAATLDVAPLDAGFLARVRNLPGIGAVRARRTVVATMRAGGEHRTVVLHALDDVTRTDIGRLQDAQGSWPPLDGEIVIERASLGFSGAVTGQALTLGVAGKAPVALTVGGVVRDVSVAPGWMDHVVHGYANLPTLSRLGMPPAFDELQFTVADPAPKLEAVRRLAWRVKALAQAEGRRVGRIDVPVPGRHVHAAQMESLTLVQGVFGALTLMVCGCLIVNLVSAMLAGQRRESGIMKAIGAGERQLAAHILALAAGLGGLAVAVALPVAVWLGRLYGGFQGELLNFPVDRHAIPAWAPLLQAAIGIGLPVLCAVWPVARACRQPVAEALRDTGLPAATSDKRARRWLQGVPLARPQLLSLHNAFRQRLRFFLSLLALAVAGAVFVGAGNLRVAVKRSVDLLFDAQRYDVSLRMAVPTPARDLAAAAAGVPGVAVAEAWGSASAALAEHDGTAGNAFALLAVPVHSRVLVPRVRSGRWLRDDDPDGVVIGGALVKDNPELRLGQRMPLLVEGRPVSLRIVGIVDSGPEALAYTAQNNAQGGPAARQSGEPASILAVRARDRGQAGQLDLIHRLRASLESRGMAVAASRLQSDSRQGIDDHLQMVVSFLGMMAWVMIVVGGMGLASTMSVGVLERRREIGVLRAIGASGGAILGMVQLEGLVMALLGWLLSLPLSLPVSVLLGDAFGNIMFAVPTSLTPEPDAALRWLGLVTAVSVLACAWPARQAMRMPVVQALHHE